MRCRTLLLSGPAAVLLLSTSGVAAPAPALPPRLETYLTRYVKLEPAARARLLAGEPVTKLLDADASKEVAIFGAVWIDGSIDRYLAAVRDIERFESGDAFRVTKKVSSPPRIEDFAQLRLPPEDVADLRACQVSRCELKLAQSAIDRIRRQIQWNRPDVQEQVDRMARELALEYVTSYQQGGNQSLAVYRDRDRPTFVAQEFASMVDRLPVLTELLPEVRRYLLEYPRAALANSESFIYWQDVNFGLKPTIRVNHLVIAEEPAGAVVASKMLYASHYFWTALELRVLVRDLQRGRGFWFVTESRSRSDGLSGFVGRIIRGKVRSETEKGTSAVLKLTKSTLEAK